LNNGKGLHSRWWLSSFDRGEEGVRALHGSGSWPFTPHTPKSSLEWAELVALNPALTDVVLSGVRANLLPPLLGSSL
jgi:hypothetical protein